MKLNHPLYPLVLAPWFAAESVAYSPMVSYLIAWLGSFFIFYMTIFSRFSARLDADINASEVMRPIVLIQIIFAGFMCCTSIFYFMEHIQDDLTLMAKCQRLALLGHISLVSGMMVMIRKSKPNKALSPIQLQKTVIKICIVSSLCAVLLNNLPALIQFRYPLMALSATTGAYLLATGLSNKLMLSILIGSTVLAVNFTNASLTGFKEGIIVQFITLAFLMYPFYKKTVVFFALPCGYFLLYILPTYTILIREKSWTGGKSKEIAREQAYQTFFDDKNEKVITENNWKFLTDRSSEIGMFIQFVKKVPDFQDYYGSQILEDSFYALIPRVLWNQKPYTETLAMQRVYTAGVAQRTSPISAKTRPVVDGYLMCGTMGVLITMFCYGIITQSICNKAERLFYGYDLGCVIMFNSLFQQLWRGNNLEFLLNNIIYAYLLMLIIYVLMNFNNVNRIYKS